MPLTKKNLIIYSIIVISTAILSALLFQSGSRLESNLENRLESPYFQQTETTKSGQETRIGSFPTPDLKELTFIQELESIFRKTLTSSISKTLMQIVIIMFLARIMGVYFRKIGQPTVIGEILAGIIIGPSLLGWLMPEFHSFLFTFNQIEILEILSNLGLILFMFVIGMDIDLSYLKKKPDSAILISHSSVYIPFLLGLLLAWILYSNYSTREILFHEFALFIAVTLSITAYPLLQRILHEKGLSRSNLGNIAVTSSAFVDIIGWILLGFTIAMIGSKSWMGLIITLSFTLLYALLMAFFFHPFLRRLSEIYVSRENLTKTAMAIVFVFLFFSSLVTEIIGLHALIGAFFAGVIMPSNQKLKSLISERIDYISLVFLLPIFFALTGLRTDLRIFAELEAWKVLTIVLGLAIAGKFLGSTLPAKYVGLNWRDSLSLGVLMNTRGLVELIVLNIGFQIGILSVYLFTILVVMTITTTLIAGPLVQWIQIIHQKWNPPPQPLEAFKKILISFAQPSMGVALIKLADFLFGANKDKTHIMAVHITPSETLSQDELQEYKSKTFADIENLMEDLDFSVEMVHRTTENITYEILNQAKLSKSRFLLMGAGKSLFSSNILGGRIRPILSYAPCNVGVLLDNGLDKIEKVLVLKKPGSTLGYEKLIHYLTREHGSKKIKIHPVAMFTTLKHNDFKGYHLVIIEIDLWKEREEFLEVEIQSLDASFLIVQFK